MKALRELVNTEITRWGHNPILSEYPIFPVSPDLTNVENCKKVVRESADVFVLIIGGKRGSLDPLTGRSIVNVEYSEAKLIGLDRIVFVDSQVWNLLSHYARNPDADFSSIVDHPDVFRFIEDIKNENKWIFQFNQTDEILKTLRHQLSIRFRDLILRARANKLTMILPYLHGHPAKRLFWFQTQSG